ncbi:MAG: hypothetical protein GWO24_00175, partial [Akkermansiaceae bacterium]|nr:hypothetical protein [Akkermansiaceae bacterium]
MNRLHHGQKEEVTFLRSAPENMPVVEVKGAGNETGLALVDTSSTHSWTDLSVGAAFGMKL